MATAVSSILDPILQPAPRLFTAADLAAMPDELPSGPVNFELEDGSFVPMSPTGRRHGNLQSRISKTLQVQGEDKGFGHAYSETGVILSKGPDSVAGPDAMFLTNRSMPIRESSEGYLESIPELVVEIRSKNDSAPYLKRKVAKYLKIGVQRIWIVDPQAKTVTEHVAAAEPKTLVATDTLQCDDIMPGFRLPLAELFRD